ncbi:MAG: serine/threonine-protein kinase [Solirubrobacteraceae bacterium]
MGNGSAGQLGERQVLGDYEILSVAGTGGMGVVYRARQLSLGRIVALKVIREDIARTPEYRERFLREARLAASVDHPNVVSVYDIGDEGGQLFLAMQWIDGEDLKRIIQRSGRLASEIAVAIGLQLAGALDTVHSISGLIHRDVKPANVLVRDVGGDHAYLTDFGVAKPADGGDELTQTGWVVGTTGYLAPEQIKGEAPRPQSDLYALGCLVFEALTGSPPFGGGNDMALRWAHANDPRPKASAVLPALGTRYDHFFSTALAVDPEHRFATGREFAAALTAADHRSMTAITAPVAHPHTPTAVGPPTPLPPPVQSQQTPAPMYPAYGYATPPPPYPQQNRPGNPLALIVLGLVALAGIAVGALAAAGVFSHSTSNAPVKITAAATTTPARATRTTASQPNTVTLTHSATASATTVTSTVPAASTAAASSTTPDTASSGLSAPLALMHPPDGGYSVLVPSDWSYQSETSSSGNPEDVWTGPDPNEQLQVVISTCASCVTSGSGGPDPTEVGTPQGTVSSFQPNPWSIGYEAYTQGDPYPDNGLIIVTKQASTPTGYAQVDLWLPDSQHSTATKILNSFSPL